MNSKFFGNFSPPYSSILNFSGMPTNSEVPGNSVPISVRTRRGSIFDRGGMESLNNFASSVQRSVNYLSTSYDSHHNRSPILSADVLSPLLGSESSHHYVFKNATTPSREDSASNITANYQSIMDSGHLLTPTISEDIEIEYEDDEIIKIVAHKSTPTQTIFNSINVLIGLGVFSIPLAFHLSGWVLGIISLTFAAYSTKMAAILLGRVMKEYPHLRTYQDIGVYVFGRKIGIFILITFTLDLLGAGLSMIIMFADSFNTLFPSIEPLDLKLLIVSILFVLNFMPLRLLSFLSLVGIICTSTTCVTIFIAGFLKKESPGSLLETLPTNLWPLSTVDFFFALGLHLAPWGGLSTFPEIYTDMALPERYASCMNFSFSFAYLVDLLTGVLGFLMFGSIIEDEVTKSILKTEGYPRIIGTIVVVLMGFLPISKLPLVSRPIITALDTFTNSHDNYFVYVGNRVGVSVVYLILSLLLTNFGVVMSLLGSAICFVICITLPLAYYLWLFPEIGKSEKILWWVILSISIFGAIGGTLAVILKTFV